MRKAAWRTAKTVSPRRELTTRAIFLGIVAFIVVGALGLLSWAAAPNPAAVATLHEGDLAKALATSAVVVSKAQAPVLLAPAALRSERASADGRAEVKKADPGVESARFAESSVIEATETAPPSHGPEQALAGEAFSAAQTAVSEKEPNATAATATPLGGTNVVAIGNIFPSGDVDFWSFTAAAGDRVYAGTQASFSAASSSVDTQLNVIASDGTTVVEFDDDDGFIGLTSSIAGATIPSAGTYYIKVNHFSATSQFRPYYLHFRLQSGSPTAETEANDTTATANPLPANGWVSGTRGTTTDVDYYSLTLAAGDTVFLSLDLDPERDLVPAAAAPGGWNGRLGIALFGDASTLILVADDPGNGSFSGPALSEDLFMTVKTGGTYYAYVDSATAIGGATFTYHLSVSVHPATPIGTSCTVYTSTDVPKAIGPAAGTTNSTITVPGNPRIEDLNVSITLSHALMVDIDAALLSPAGNENSLFTDIGSTTTTAAQTLMDLDLDDEAGLPPLFTVMKGPGYQPESAYRLSWFKGELGGGTWTLRLRDDLTNANGGTLTAWSITICEPPAPAACSGTLVTVHSSDFESGAQGYTHSGAADEWELGLPSFAPITTCNGGTSCWKTDLDNTYNVSSNQDLVSPTISLSGLGAPIRASWAQKYQMATGTGNLLDSFLAEVRNPGPTNATTLYQFLDGNMTDLVGSPAATINESAGWGLVTRNIDAYANQNIQLRFNLTSDAATNLAGLAIDDVTVTACCTTASCDDLNPCTDDICSAGGCTHVNNDAASCSDGNPCTNPDSCSGGVCVPGPNPCNDNNACTIDVCDGGGGCSYNLVNCDDLNPCTDDGCDPGTGCTHTNNSNLCTDSNPCTIGDVCSGGACVPGSGALPAAVQFCNTSTITIPTGGAASPYPSPIVVTGQPSYVCAVTVDLNGITHTFPDDIDVLLARLTGANAIIMSDTGGGTAVTSVNLTLSDAAATSLPDGAPLVSGTFKPTNFGAGDVFPVPAPTPSGGSALSAFTGTNPNGTWNLWVVDQFTPDGGTMSGWCVNLVAVCGVDADCEDGNVCTTDACVNSTCTHTNNSNLCNDGNACTPNDTCTGGVCVGGAPPNCDDGDACTTDSCNPGTGLCEHAGIVCNDNNACTDDTCNPGTGCVYTPNDGNACSDNSLCTSPDVCQNGVCVGQNPVVCPPDLNVCTTEACDPATGACISINNTNACDDGDVCTTGDTCGPTLSENFDGETPPNLPGTWSSSSTGSGLPWTTVSTSSSSAPNSAFGFDGAGPLAADELLVSPTFNVNSPTAQLTFRNRWTFENNLGTFYDGGVLEISIGGGAFADILTAGGTFVSGGYTGVLSTCCSNPLATRSAWAGVSAGYPAYLTTVVNLPAAAAGQTVQLQWRIGTDTSIAAPGQNIDTIVLIDGTNVCNPGTTTIDCNDNNPCTDDFCDAILGCQHSNNVEACDDGNACTILDACSAGACSGSAIVCDDSNPCTADSCDSGSGCVFTPITAPPETQNVVAAANKTTYTWSPAAFATRYDVVRGALSALPVGPGGGDEVCFDDLPGPTLVDGTVPGPGTGNWYLSRGENACGNGTYGTQHNGTPRITTTCP